MRISDWSSDVCSSDLRTGGARGLSPGIDLRGRNALAVPQGRHLARLWRAESGRRTMNRVIRAPLPKAAKGERPFSLKDADHDRVLNMIVALTEIGRASRRERVEQVG